MTVRRAADTRRGERGATLIELVISIVVIGIAVSGSLLAVNHVVARSADPMLQHQASAIAEAYLEEILARPFADPDGGAVCGAPEASRDLFDDVCDYDGLDDVGARSQDDTAVAGLGAYRVRVDVDPAASLNGLTGAANVLRVDVRVNHTQAALGIDLTLSGYRTSY